MSLSALLRFAACCCYTPQVRFSVPKEAVQLDFVFSNVMSGEGIYDNRGGFDYHLPIEGGTGQ